MDRERIEETVRLWQAEPDKAKGKPTVIARAEGSKAVMEHGSFPVSSCQAGNTASLVHRQTGA